ncbi:DUF4136 domain-containing protein [Pollutimonas harenae]|uniref:DUF4136 domain-containing protein n=1 Tax=Pollutimonas harenae TaxID=657015 RepID=A0A853H523_9BURK|nr:DUF4136 domain-containing protein [Pollutimonas harenae]NYT85653.1 DUF4136 domain-containing protein [Pollutimonas harenae]TEA70730.1 DUF4136 domain-containing protein [Pollutimonas harenae]
MWYQICRYQKELFRCLVLGSVFLLAGCASTLSARVTSFQQWPGNAQGETYRIVRTDPQKNNLEFEAVADMVRANIGPTGLVEAQSGKARFDLHITYDNPVTKTWVQRYNDPYLNDGWMGPAFGGYYGGFSGWGWGGIYMAPSVSNFPVDIYNNTLTIVINDNRANNAEVYRSSAVNQSSNDNLLQVMPYLARAVFDRFPGNNGQVREVQYERQR